MDKKIKGIRIYGYIDTYPEELDGISVLNYKMGLEPEERRVFFVDPNHNGEIDLTPIFHDFVSISNDRKKRKVLINIFEDVE